MPFTIVFFKRLVERLDLMEAFLITLVKVVPFQSYYNSKA